MRTRDLGKILLHRVGVSKLVSSAQANEDAATARIGKALSFNLAAVARVLGTIKGSMEQRGAAR